MEAISEQMEHCEKLAADLNNKIGLPGRIEASEFFKALYMPRITRWTIIQMARDLRKISPGRNGSQKRPLAFKQIAKRIKK